MAPKKRERRPYHRHALEEQINDPAAQGVRTIPRQEKKRKRSGQEEENEALSAKLSGRILKAARDQQEEIDAEEQEKDGPERVQMSAGVLAAALQRVQDSDDEEDDEDEDLGAGYDGDSLYGGAEEEVDPNDEAALEAFMAHRGGPALLGDGAATMAGGNRQLSLGDLIVSKLREKQREAGVAVLPEEGEDEEDVPEGLDEKVIQVYRGVGKLLSRYSAGKIPKAFKIIPNLKNWEEILYLTDPEGWSPQAMLEATKLFVSNLNARLAQRFLALVLLPRLRQDIKKEHKLHLSLFMAMKKAAYKPGAFFKGLLLPLCQSCTCTLREAFIFSSILRRISIPVLHSSAALLRMTQLEYCGTTSFFIRTLLDKKYTLPYRVMDALVDHFVRFADDERQMPVVWHQCLLCFIQRYKDEVRPEDKEAIRKLCHAQRHYQVTPEVIRELDHGRGRGNEVIVGAASVASRSGFSVIQPQLGKNVAEQIKGMPPVPMMEDE
ncbi:hypothetical protein CEUSTIGMA_g3736.t1 [Chlamydomonas eustigma]|uniref:Bystin n=1 Tax=Chlamydomonas eustigma TaxID=1157962 RepID=A0A250WZN3_9CHLO|nr:hypothetical protein CEUSTIGMA_g3736.t1 [Chlamydomonas eustigma]|eukprot:GAX76291.1 hypothetical protein CEUSTIGMA_g3736.t1 [Chlamydomonas eustigma]